MLGRRKLDDVAAGGRDDAARLLVFLDRQPALVGNRRPDRLDPPHELLQVAVDAGCLFSIDTDSHAPGQLDWLIAGCERAVQHGIGPDRVITTLTADQLVHRPR